MTFHMDIIKECLGNWNQLRIYQLLMRQPKPMSENQMARLLNIPLTTLHRTLKSLGETRLIKSHKVGTSSFWIIDNESYLYETLKPILQGLNLIQPPLPYLKKLILNRLHIPHKYRVILFGSIIEGKDTPSSDIDLCIIYPSTVSEPSTRLKKEIESLQESCLTKFGKVLNPLFINESLLVKASKKELYQNIFKGKEMRHDTCL